MTVLTNIADLRRMARRRVAKAVFDYVDRGSYDEATQRANRAEELDVSMALCGLRDIKNASPAILRGG